MPNLLPPRWRKVRRDLARSKARTALVVLSIAVGVFAVGAIMTTRLILDGDLGVAYRGTNPQHATLFTNKPFGDDLVRLARHVDGVADTEGLRDQMVRVKVGPDEWRQLRLTGRQDYTDVRLNKIDSEQGDWPPPRHEVLIERNSFALLKSAVGNTITIETPDRKEHEIRVAGLAHDIGAPPAVFTGQVYGYVTLDTMAWLGLDRDFDKLLITVAEQPDDVKHIGEVADRVKRKIEQGPISVLQIDVPTPGQHPANDVVQPLLLILTALGGFSLFLSAFLVVNTITALLTQQLPQIGVMKAIGAGTKQLLAMYVGTVLAYGLLALVVAVPLAAAGGYALAAYLASLINFDLAGFRIPLPALAVEIAIALLVPLLAALWPVLGGTRISVREALSAQGLGGSPARRRRTILDFGFWILDWAFPRLRAPHPKSKIANPKWGVSRPMLLSLRNTFRRKARLALTLVTLTLGGAIFIGVLSLQASLMKTLDAALAYWQYDVQVSFAQNYRVDRIVEEAKQVPGVVDAESWVSTSVQRLRPNGHDGPTIYLFGPPADTKMIKPVLVAGRWLQTDDDDAIVLNTAAVKLEPDLKVGDDVVLKFGKKETTWHVVGLVESTLTGSVGYVNQPALAHLTQSQGRANNVQVVTAQHSGAAETAAAQALKTRLDDAGMRVSTTETTDSIRVGVGTQFNIIVFLMAIMAVLMAVVGGLGLMGTMGINVLERSREIGVLRAIGASTGAMLRIVVAEGLLIGALSWLAGAALSLPISKLMSDAIGEALFHAQLNFAFSFPGALLWLLVVLTLAALASLLPALRAARITVREVLAYE